MKLRHTLGSLAMGRAEYYYVWSGGKGLKDSVWLVAAILLLAVSKSSCGLVQGVYDADVFRTSAFQDTLSVMWANDHVQTEGDGEVVQLRLDQRSGGGFSSVQRYRFGYISMHLKLVPGDSAGVVTAYYLTSGTKLRDELDFEFLGNKTGQPYNLQTNMYTKGIGGREQRIRLWFDPSADFHEYGFLWNNHQIVFYVDKVPVRVYRNTHETASLFPSQQPMRLYSSIWNGDQWATRGGMDKIDWNSAPFFASYRSLNADACEWRDPYPACASTTWKHWWDQPKAWTLSSKERKMFTWVNSNLMEYNYCTDRKRYATPPAECWVSPW